MATAKRTTKKPAARTVRKNTAKQVPSTSAAKKRATACAEAATSSHTRSLAKYQSMRDFEVTAEPSGNAPKKGASSEERTLSFVVQKHAASRLHFDFRLELDGVLLSWSVPKGPSLHPETRRLAVQVEDHPLDYGDFEGIIPKGQYGGGTVLLWDRGTWKPEADPRNGLEKGHLVFELAGERLRGRFHLVRSGREPKQWLLFKSKDAHAKKSADDVADRNDHSVASGRTMKQIADAKDRTWQSNRAEKAVPSPKRSERRAVVDVALQTAETETLVELVERLPTTETFTNLDKVLFGEQGLTKAALVAYYAVMAEQILPHLRGRPLTFKRCPNGASAHCFFQKHPGKGASEALRYVPLVESDGAKEKYMIADDRDGLYAAAQAGALELHVWGSRDPHFEKPDRLVFDLDPDPTVAFSTVVEAAFAMRHLLQSFDLESFVMTTGGKGLHVVVPVAARLGWDDAKDFTHGVANQLVALAPRHFTANMAKAQRKGKIFIDYLRNGRGATAICPYSTRARTGAPVATPLSWSELEGGVDPAAFTVRSLPARISTMKTDPWAGHHDMKQPVRAAARKAVAA